MKRVAILMVIFVIPLGLLAQQNKFEYTPKVKNKLTITDLLGEITLKNTSGNTVVIESDFDLDKPERADGLTLLGADEDNSGMGVNVNEENGIVSIKGITQKVKDYAYTIYVPDGIAVYLKYNSPFVSGDLEIDSYKGSVEIKTLAADVKLTNCEGPFTVSSISGDIEAVYSQLSQKEPTSLASVSGLVDVSLPASTKATIKISNMTGDVYHNLKLKSTERREKDERSDGLDEIKHGSKSEYTLNGGGQKLLLNTVSGNIYLREK